MYIYIYTQLLYIIINPSIKKHRSKKHLIHRPNFFKFIKGRISLPTETRPRTAVKTPMLLAWAQGSWTKTPIYDRYGLVPICIKVVTFGSLQPTKKSNNTSPTSIGNQYTLKIHTNVDPLETITSSSGAISIGVRGTKGLMPRMDAKTFIGTWRKKGHDGFKKNQGFCLHRFSINHF